MKIQCKKTDLLNSVNIVLKAVQAKTTMPILECIVIEVVAGKIKLISNDMELGIETIVQGEVVEDGIIAINAKLFSDIIRKLPDNNILIETDSEFVMHIRCEKAKFDIMGKDYAEFPVLPKIERDNFIEISQFSLKEVIRQTVFSISDNQSNKMMTGELFEITGDKFKVVSLDGHRISIRSLKLKSSYDSIKMIVPGKTLIEISKILSGEMEDMVKIFFTDRHIIFEFDDTMVLSRLIEGEFYKVEQMITSDYETKLTVRKREFLDCIDRATLMVKESEKKPIVLNIQDGTMNLKIQSFLGTMKEDIDIVKEGKDILIAFNPRFLMDALRVIDDDEVDIYLFNPKAPCFIRDKEETYIYLILPVNFNVG
jgi:DNA polymerase-3 subunit beta